MKETTYKCDRCGCALATDGEVAINFGFILTKPALCKLQFFTRMRDSRLRAVQYDLCENCRNSLERWLNNE